jgi:oxygen-independent coproporphyrinogen-3 oxidase
MREAGVTRISLGVQSWNPRQLAILGRDHAPDEARESYKVLREAEIPTVNLDMMFSLPGQSLEDWETDLRETLALNPDHLSAYNLTYEEDTEFLKRFDRGEFTRDEMTDAAFFTRADDLLTEAGYRHYETSNFARPGHESAHNRAYWLGEDYLGIGPGAVSTIGGTRWTNIRDTDVWMDAARRFGRAAASTESLDTEAWRLERLALELRTDMGLRLDVLRAKDHHAVTRLTEDGLVTVTTTHIIPTRRGQLLVDSLALALA